MPKIKKNKIEQCTKIFIYRDLNRPFPIATFGRTLLLGSQNLYRTWPYEVTGIIETFRFKDEDDYEYEI